eukprot:1234517-Amphidinium_carterae.1
MRAFLQAKDWLNTSGRWSKIHGVVLKSSGSEVSENQYALMGQSHTNQQPQHGWVKGYEKVCYVVSVLRRDSREGSDVQALGLFPLQTLLDLHREEANSMHAHGQ